MIVQLEIPLETVDAAIQIAKRHGVTTVLNAAPARKLPEEMLAGVDILILNETEVRALCGYPASDPAEAIHAGKRLLKVGPGRVIVTLGDMGAVYAGPEGEMHVPTFQVESVDSTGAGDAFVAAFTVGWAQRMDVEQCLRYACAAGAITTMKVGAQESLPTQEEVASLLSSKHLR